jgi:non-homologous end joining protein Ku
MGNSIKTAEYYNSNYASINDEEIQNIRNKYKVVEVDWLDSILVNSKMFNDDYFIKSPEKKEVVNKMLEYYLNDKDKHNMHIYSITDYLCNERERICICNTHAEDFRKIYEGINYRKNTKYISWCKKNDNF